MTKDERQRALEAEFSVIFLRKAQLEEQVKEAHNALMRLQGRLDELQRTEDP